MKIKNLPIIKNKKILHNMKLGNGPKYESGKWSKI